MAREHAENTHIKLGKARENAFWIEDIPKQITDMTCTENFPICLSAQSSTKLLHLHPFNTTAFYNLYSADHKA
jgi:hypothetical protein